MRKPNWSHFREIDWTGNRASSSTQATQSSAPVNHDDNEADDISPKKPIQYIVSASTSDMELKLMDSKSPTEEQDGRVFEDEIQEALQSLEFQPLDGAGTAASHFKAIINARCKCHRSSHCLLQLTGAKPLSR